jgi:hypothetical protein
VVGERSWYSGPLNITLPQLQHRHPQQSQQPPQAQDAPAAHNSDQLLEQLKELEQVIVLGQLPPEQFVQALDQMDQVMGQLAESPQPGHQLQQIFQPDQQAIKHALEQTWQDVVSVTDDFARSTGRLPTQEQRERGERIFLKLYIIKRFYMATLYAPERNYGLHVARQLASEFQESLNSSAQSAVGVHGRAQPSLGQHGLAQSALGRHGLPRPLIGRHGLVRPPPGLEKHGPAQFSFGRHGLARSSLGQPGATHSATPGPGRRGTRAMRRTWPDHEGREGL